MTTPDELSIDLARQDDFPDVCALIVAGLTQRWGSYLPSVNPDLQSFDSTYASASVIAAKRAGEVVGCGILVDEAPGTARIVRMSVAADLQRTGIGGKVLRALLDRALVLGYSQVLLETTADWHSAISFYKRHGFAATESRDGDQHFRLNLNKSL